MLAHDYGMREAFVALHRDARVRNRRASVPKLAGPDHTDASEMATEAAARQLLSRFIDGERFTWLSCDLYGANRGVVATALRDAAYWRGYPRASGYQGWSKGVRTSLAHARDFRVNRRFPPLP